MTYHLYGSPETLAIGVPSSRVPHDARQEFLSALELRTALLAMQQDMELRTQSALDLAKKQGFAEGKTAVEEHLATAIAALNDRISQFEAQQQDQIASAAFAATRAIIGQLPEDAVLSGIVQEAVARLDVQNEAIMQIEISPAMLSAVSARVQPDTAKKLTANPALTPQDCVVVTASGRLVASLDVQLESLAKRWGVQDAPDQNAAAQNADAQNADAVSADAGDIHVNA
jgi:flagellar biosynthesis/type III secretory pathway protein FliH